MLKEMSVNLTENDLVIFCQKVLRFFTEFFYSAYVLLFFTHIQNATY